MKRREFIALFGGVGIAWPLAAYAQQTDRMRHIGVVAAYAESDPEAQTRVIAFRQALGGLGWIEGRNIAFFHEFTECFRNFHRRHDTAPFVLAGRALRALVFSPADSRRRGKFNMAPSIVQCNINGKTILVMLVSLGQAYVSITKDFYGFTVG